MNSQTASPPVIATLGRALAWAEARLARTDSPRLDAEVLLAHVLGRSRSHVRAWPERELAPAHGARYRALVRERLQGRPLAQITGRREFWSVELEITNAVLVPRPETEHLVEAALARMPAAGPGLAVDLGTGSGAVALALARERPGWRILATDISPAALAVARSNAARQAVGNLDFRLGDWLRALESDRAQVIVSNPPYLADDDPLLGRPPLSFEPRTALAAGGDGLAALRRLAAGAPSHLLPGGWLLLEHGSSQGAAVRALLARSGFEALETLRDYAGLDRVSLGRWLG